MKAKINLTGWEFGELIDTEKIEKELRKSVVKASEFALEYALSEDGGWSIYSNFSAIFKEGRDGDPLDMEIDIPCLNEAEPPQIKINLRDSIYWIAAQDGRTADPELWSGYLRVAVALRELADEIENTFKEVSP